MGGIHGAIQVIENALIPPKYKKSTGFLKWLRVLIIFAFCSFTWIFFVSNSIGDSIYIISHAFTGINSPITYLHAGFNNIGLGKMDLSILTISILILIVFDYLSLKKI